MVFLRRLSLLFLVITGLCQSVLAQIDPTVPYFGILAPASISSFYSAVNGQYGNPAFGPGVSNGDVLAEVALAAEGDSLLCQPTNEDFSGKIVLIRRGSCEFSKKIYQAQLQGAVGAIIWNYDETHLNMGGGALGDSVGIPSIFVPQSIGAAIKQALDGAETVLVNFGAQPLGISLISGMVSADLNASCAADSGEPALANFMAVAQGSNNKTYFGLSGPDGHYQVFIDTLNGPYTLSLVPPSSLWSLCPATASVPNAGSGDTTTVDFFAQPEALCALMTASISTPFLRRCFPNPFEVQVCNEGTAPAADAYVLVDLDPLLEPLQNPSQPFTVEPDGRYRFDLGTAGIGQCFTITFSATVDCDSSVLGQTLCYEAHAFPDSSCVQTAAWSGANISVTSTCTGDSVRFQISNTGVASMGQSRNYIVIEDDLMLQEGSFQLNAGQQTQITLPANGATWRLEAEQEPNHPVPGNPAATVEGCTTGNSFTTGYYLMFPIYQPGESVDIECQPVIGSWDPNDKQALPEGYGPQHLVLPNTGLDYRIRFQNTGTDTAFTVVVRDTLSPWLDVKTLRPGASSHPYQLEIEQGHILVFRFSGINLLDSFSNEPASHGFLKFHIDQKADNPLGIQIANQAAIYFDLNPPVFTETVLREVGLPPHITAVPASPETPAHAVRIFPNPATGTARIRLEQALPPGARWQLFDSAGVPVQQGSVQAQQLQLSLPGLAPGLYWLEWQLEGRGLGGTKLMIQR